MISVFMRECMHVCTCIYVYVHVTSMSMHFCARAIDPNYSGASLFGIDCIREPGTPVSL